PHTPALHSFPTRRSSDLRYRGKGLSLGVINQLHVGMLQAPEHAEARPFRRPENLAADPQVNFSPSFGSTQLPSHYLRPPSFQPSDRKSTRLNSSHVKISY